MEAQPDDECVALGQRVEQAIHVGQGIRGGEARIVASHPLTERDAAVLLAP